MRIFIKNTEGQPSASLTMTLVAFIVVILWFVVWVIGAGFGLPVPPFEASTAMGLLGPLLTLYFGRRWSSNASGQISGTGSGEHEPVVDPEETKVA